MEAQLLYLFLLFKPFWPFASLLPRAIAELDVFLRNPVADRLLLSRLVGLVSTDFCPDLL